MSSSEFRFNMASSGASKAIVAKHPDVTTHSSSTHAAEGEPSPHAPTASSKGSSHLPRTTSSASSASTSRSEGRSAGGLNSRNRAAVRLSQLERLKAHRQSAQAGREAGQRAPGMAALERQPPSHTVRQPTTSASRPGERPSGPGSAGVGSSMPLPRGVARTGQRSTSKGYLDRYAASCAVSGKDAKPLKRQQEAESAQLEEQVSTGVGHRTRSGAFVRLSSAESRTGAPDTGKHDQEAMTAALYNLAEAEQQRPATGVSCSDTAPLSSHASVASQPAASADGHLSTSDSGRIEDTGQDRCSFRLDSVHDQAGLPGLAEAELGGLPNECPQAPGRTKPLPQADAPVCSPHTHPEGSHASSASPARLRSPLPTPGVPASSTDVLFVQPPPEIAAVPRVVKAVESIKDTGRQAPLAASADGSLQLMVNLHAYAAAGLPRHGDVAQQHDPVASIIELGPTKAASLDKLRTPLTSVEEGPAHQFWEVQKRVVDVSAVPAQQRPRNLPKFLAGLCSCFAPQPHASPEPVMMNLCMTPGMPGSGNIFSASLDCSEPIEEEFPSMLDSQPDMEVVQPQPPAKTRAEPTAAGSLSKQASFPPAVETQPSLHKAAPEQGSIPAGLQKQGSIPASQQQQQGSMPAGLQQQKQQDSNTPGPEVASSWSPPPDQELVPFVSSSMALFNGALPGSNGLAGAASQDSIDSASDRVQPAASAGDDTKLAEETEVQGGATLQTQTSLAELLQSEDSARTAPVQRPSERITQGGKEDATKCFVPGSGGKNSLKAFLERRHPGVPSVLLDPKAPAPWRSSPSRVKKSSPNQAPAPFAASPAGPRKGSPARRSSGLQGQGSPLHVPAYQREGSPAQAALAKSMGPTQTSWKQTQAWSPAKTSIALVKGTAKHPTGAAISIAYIAAPGQAAELAKQRVAAADTSALRQPACSEEDKQARKEATPVGKRALHAAITQLHEVSQAGRISLEPPSKAALRQPAVPAQAAVDRSGRLLKGRDTAAANGAPRRRHAGRAGQGQGMPHLQAAILGPGLRTNALLESGGSMGSAQSMQCSRVAMQSIGEAQRAASRDRSRSVASTRAPSGTGSSGVTALERRVLQQYLGARQLRDKAAAERGVPSPSRRYSSAQPPQQQPGTEAGGPVPPEGSARANTGLSASLEEELRDLERHWEDLDLSDAQNTAQAQPSTHGTEGYSDKEQQRQAQKKVACVIEHWESRSISADALQHMRDRASAGQRTCSADGSASGATSAAQGSREEPDVGLTYAALDMLEQLSSPAEKLAGPELREGMDRAEPSSKVSTDMDSICEARSLPDSHSPLGSATSSLSHRDAAARSAEELPSADDSQLMAAIAAAASPGASLPRSASLTTGVKPQKLVDTFSTLPGDSLPGSPRVENLNSAASSQPT